MWGDFLVGKKYILHTDPYKNKNADDLSIKELQDHYDRVKSEMDANLKAKDDHQEDPEFTNLIGSYEYDVKLILRVLDEKRKVRNDHFLNWLFEPTPNWDTLTFDDLVQLYERSTVKYGDSTSGGGGAKKEKQLEPQDLEALEQEKLKPTESESHSTKLDMASVENATKRKRYISTMREVSNRDANDPIDTEAEYQEGNDLKSPLSTRDVDAEMEDYKNKVRYKAKEKYDKKFKKLMDEPEF